MRLLDAGADWTLTDDKGRTALDICKLPPTKPAARASGGVAGHASKVNAVGASAMAGTIAALEKLLVKKK